MSPGPGLVLRPEVGLCSVCRHARTQKNPRGNAFWRCALAESDARFLRYPPLPVRSCAGFERDSDPPAAT